MSTLKIEIAEAFEPLLEPMRYKAAYGGRGGGKSHFFAMLIVLSCARAPTRVVCIREVQNSIKDSVKELIQKKIELFGLQSLFEIKEQEIRVKNGGLIVFRGMQSYNADNIKSLEGFDIAWVEEAHSLSHRSWRMLRPTIRKPQSEIWCSWNPQHDTDAVDAFFRGKGKRDDSTVIQVNWDDNPWFPDVLRAEMEGDYKTDPEMAEHIWGGGYEIITEGSYYAKLISDAMKTGRVGVFPYNSGYPVYTAWDLGVDDYTAIWFVQRINDKYYILDYWETSGDGFDQIMADALPEIFNPPNNDMWRDWDREAAIARLERNYRYADHYLPHDVRVREQGSSARHRYEIFNEYGIPSLTLKKGVAAKPEERIQAVKALLPYCYFNETDRVMRGVKRLRRYSRKFNEQMETYQGPLHDENSHGADAFGEFALNNYVPIEYEKPKPKPTEPTYMADDDGRLYVDMTVKEIIEAKRRKRELKRGIRNR